MSETKPPTQSLVRNDLFDASKGFERGGSKLRFVLWHLTRWFFFTTTFPWPSSLKARILRLFGCRVGHGVVIKPRVSIHLPWKLSIGDHTWVGEEVNIINFEPVAVGNHCCLSQRAFICAGNHDFRDPSMPYRNAPITIRDGCWIGACSFVAPGVVLGTDCIVTAGSVVTKSVGDGDIVRGNPAEVVGKRWK